jgi:large subunit ribosomal protein L6
MSRIGRKPVAIPSGVKVSVRDGMVYVEGPKGKLDLTHHPKMTVKVEGNQVLVSRPDDERENRSLHGMTRSLIQNMVDGVSKGYSKMLEISGTGYRAEVQGQKLTISVGFSSPVVHMLPKSVTATIEKQTKITLTSIDKQELGVQAATIRGYRPPEPYQGKGIKYSTERIKRKAGKTGAGATA